MARDTLTGKTVYGMKVGDESKKDPQVPWTKIIVHPTGKKVQKGATWTPGPSKKQVWVTGRTQRRQCGGVGCGP